jgi:nucleoside phosphorylase
MPRSRPILIVSAFPPELAPLRRALAKRRIPASAVRCVPVGIGAIDAAAGAARAIARFAPRAVIFVGTAGRYGILPATGGVAIARRIHLASTAVARGDGYLPAPMRIVATAHVALREALRRAAGAGAAVVDVATPLAITRSAALARRLARATGATVENLEAFAVARAAEGVRVPFAAVLGIANHVGPKAHAEWLAHQAHATNETCHVLVAWISAKTSVLA